MKSKWRVSSDIRGWYLVFRVFRWIDESKGNYCFNREYADGIFTLRSQAEALANMLNGEEDL